MTVSLRVQRWTPNGAGDKIRTAFAAYRTDLLNPLRPRLGRHVRHSPHMIFVFVSHRGWTYRLSASAVNRIQFPSIPSWVRSFTDPVSGWRSQPSFVWGMAEPTKLLFWDDGRPHPALMGNALCPHLRLMLTQHARRIEPICFIRC